VEAEDGMIFRYRLTAIRATQVGATGLPSWMHWTPPDTLTGIPSEPGTVFIPVWAANATQREEDVLVVNVLGGTRSLNWRPVTSGTTLDLLDVTFGGGLFVAVGEVGTVLTSTDGTTWISRSTGRMETLRSITWGNGRFVAVGTGGLILTSTNSIDWTTAATGSMEYNGTCWGTNLFVAVGNNRTIRTSINGTTWVNRGTGGSETLGGVAWGGNGFVAVGGLFSEGPSVFHSTDGATWNWRDTGTWSDGFYDVAWGNGVYVAAGYRGKLMTSTDGITWTSRYGFGTAILRGVAFYDNQFVVVGHSGAMFTSHRGAEWTSVASGTNINLHAVAGGLQKFVAVGQYGAILVADYEPDRDGDGAPDWQERLAGTDALDSESALRIKAVTPVPGGVVVRWQSESNKLYRLERATNLTTAPAFNVNVRSNILATPPINTETDTTAVGSGPYFYRIRLE
ncbi:MAG: hypothetical protein QHJ82_11050, partial [Verrucomicrobiota bacterium]|nr:hypothetical protein [Verrucomicrobiota bacterium]